MKIHFNSADSFWEKDLQITPEEEVRLLPDDLIIRVVAQLPFYNIQQELAIYEACRRTCEIEDDFMGAIGYHVQISLIISSFLN